MCTTHFCSDLYDVIFMKFTWSLASCDVDYIVFTIILAIVSNQGAWSLSERSHWSFWLDIICLGENKFGRNP